MKKLSLLLAIVLCFGILVGCDSNETARGGDVEIPGYPVSMDAEGWKTAEETDYDLEMTRDGVTMILRSFSPVDFVDPPTAEDLFDDCNSQLTGDYTDVQQKGKTSTSKDGKRVTMTALFSFKDGETTKYLRAYLVDFDGETGAMTWAGFVGSKSKIEDDKDDFDDIVNSLACDMKAIEAQLNETEPQFDEDGNLITEPPADFEETPEDEEFVEPTYEGDGDGEPAITEPEAVPPETTAPAETTPATTAPSETTAATQAA